MLSSSESSSPSDPSMSISTSPESRDFTEWWDPPRCNELFSGLSANVTAAGNGSAGKGLWPAGGPKLDLVGVAASSVPLGGGIFEPLAVLGRGVVGLFSCGSFCRYGSGVKPVLTGLKETIFVDDGWLFGGC